MAQKKLKVAVFFGGTSEERKVSLISGLAVAKSLDRSKYEVIPVEISESGQWLTDSQTIRQIASASPTSLVASSKEIVAVDKIHDKEIDVAFLALHGPGGEDGSVQGMLEVLKIPYTFSKVQASALAMDKVKTKRIVSTEGIQVAPQIYFSKNEYEQDPEKFLNQIQGQVVIKPNKIGSSFGITITDEKEEIKKAINIAFKHDSEVLIEKYIAGKEFTTPVIGNSKLEALPVIEIVPKNGSKFFDFNAKYYDEYRDEIVPARISKELTANLQEIGVKVHKLLGCRGVSRSDFIVTDTQEIYFLEINTIPGLTSASLLPQAAAAVGMSYPQLLDKLIDLALDKE